MTDQEPRRQDPTGTSRESDVVDREVKPSPGKRDPEPTRGASRDTDPDSPHADVDRDDMIDQP